MGQAWDWTAWIWWAAALLLGAGGLWLAYRSLLADRSRGRRRCRKCWYIMDGLDSLRCPECGWEAKRVRQLHRTRRRWRWFAVSVILLIGAYACYLTPKGQRNGWETVMPTSVLVFIAPIDKYQVGWQPGNGLSPPPAPTDPFGIELRERVARGSLYAWQWQVMLDRWFDAHPEEKKGLIGIRRQWPEGVPIRARATAPENLISYLTGERTGSGPCRIRLSSPRGRWVDFNPWIYEATCDRTDLGTPRASAEELPFDYRLLLDDRVIWKTKIRKPVAVGGEIEDVIEPVASEHLTSWLARNLRPRLVGYPAPSDIKPSIYVDGIETWLGGADGICVGYIAELLRDGEVVAVAEGLAEPFPKEWWDHAPEVEWLRTRWLVPVPDQIPGDGEVWQIRIRSEASLALLGMIEPMDFYWGGRANEDGASRYWKGEFTVPVTGMSVSPGK